MRAEIDRRALVQRRQEVQEKIANKKGNRSRDQFDVGDRVRIKSHLDGRWGTKGVVTEARHSGSTSPPASFMVLTDTGAEVLRHKSYLKFDTAELDLEPEKPVAENLSASETPARAAVPEPDSTAAPKPDTQAKPWEGRLRARREKE